MAENTGIQWTDHTFNPWMGCAKVAPGCANCYAENLMDTRYKKVKWGEQGTRVKTSPANWKKVSKWNREAQAKFGRKARVFCASLADVAEDRPELVPWRAELCDLIRACDNLDFQLLTKRPENMPRLFPADVLERCWVGTSISNQADADRNLPLLLRVNAAVLFVSAEPLTEPVDLSCYMPAWVCNICGTFMRGRGGAGVAPDEGEADPCCSSCGRLNVRPLTIDWVIGGGESGDNARLFKWDWALSLRDQCAAADVPFFFKQTGALFHDGRFTRKMQGKGDSPTDWPGPMPRKIPVANERAAG